MLNKYAAEQICSEWNEKLKPITGLTPDGQPRMRLVWGETATRYWEGAVRLKYCIGRTPSKVIGHSWKNLVTGETGTVQRMDEVPDSAMYTGPILSPEEDIGDPHFWLEWWVSPQQVAASPAALSDTDGERDWNEAEGALGEFPREGLWMGMHRLRDFNGNFLHPGEFILDCARRTMRDFERIGTGRSWRDFDKTAHAIDEYQHELADRQADESLADDARHIGRDEFKFQTQLTLPVSASL